MVYYHSGYTLSETQLFRIHEVIHTLINNQKLKNNFSSNDSKSIIENILNFYYDLTLNISSDTSCYMKFIMVFIVMLRKKLSIYIWKRFQYAYLAPQRWIWDMCLSSWIYIYIYYVCVYVWKIKLCVPCSITDMY